jgi:hypothetical protein
MRKRYIWALLLAGAVFLGWRYGYQAALKYFFRLSGTVTLSETLAGSRPGANSMLFVVARNERGVPVAVTKIINPVFPARFELTSASLIMPDVLTRSVYLEALLNTHGQLGIFKKGDLRGERRDRDPFISKDLEITLSEREK